MSTVVRLRKAIEAHGETASTLTLRRPRGRDIAACGNPRLFVRRGKMLVVEVDAEAIHAYIVSLAGIPPSSVDTIDVSDWADVQEAVLDFFEPAPKPGGAVPAAAPEAGLAQSDQPTVKMPFQDTTT